MFLIAPWPYFKITKGHLKLVISLDITVSVNRFQEVIYVHSRLIISFTPILLKCFDTLN